MPTKCPHCFKEYKTASSFGKHFTICHALANAEKKTEILDTLQLTNLVRMLVKDNKILKNKIKKMESIGTSSRKIDIIGWFNKNMKEGKDYKEWIETIDVDEKALKYVLEMGFNKGVIEIILNSCKNEWNEDHIPIRCFNELKGIYVYDKNVWRLITDKEFKNIICLIQRKLFIKYKDYEDKMDVYDVNKNDKYLNDMKILCGNGEFLKNSSVIEKKFYSEIRLCGKKFITQRI